MGVCDVGLVAKVAAETSVWVLALEDSFDDFVFALVIELIQDT